MKSAPILSLPKKLKSGKRSRVNHTHGPNFEFFSLHTKSNISFNLSQKLQSINYTSPYFETYKSLLTKLLKSLSVEDANILVKLVIRSILCPMINDTESFQKLLSGNGKYLKQLFGNYVSSEYVQDVLISYRDKDQDIIGEIQRELNLLNNHPVYKEEDFPSANEFKLWKDRRQANLKRKIKTMEKVPPFSGNLKIRILNAKGLGGILYSPEQSNCNIYCIIKVGSLDQKSSIRSGSWDPVFGETFNFKVSSLDTRIKVEVWDKKIIGSSFLGCIVIYPSDFMWEEMPYEKWYNLHSRARSNDTSVTGSIRIVLNLSFRLGPSKTNGSDGDIERENSLSSLFSFGQNSDAMKEKPKRQKIENLNVYNYHEYYKYLLYLVLLESFEQEKRNNETKSSDKAQPIDIVTNNSKSVSNLSYSSSGSPVQKPSQTYSSRKVGTLRKNKELGNPVKPPKELQWLLDNFLQRYNISQTNSYLVLLEVLISSFTLTSEHLTMIHFALMELEASRCTEELIWNQDVQLYEKYVLNGLKNNLEEVLCNYFIKFPENKPEGALSIVIVLYSLVTSNDPSKLCLYLKEKTETSMIKMYKYVVGDRPTDESLIEACKFVSAVLECECEYFSKVFPSELNHIQHVTNIYYSEMLSKNISSLLRTSPPISENIMALYTQLKKLNQKIIKLNPDIEIMPLSQMFQPFVSKWIERIGEQLPSWCNTVIKGEKWKALSLDEQNPILHSISVQELFDIIYELYGTYKDFEMRAAKDLKNLQLIIEKTIALYVKGILNCLHEELKDQNIFFFNSYFSVELNDIPVSHVDENKSSNLNRSSTEGKSKERLSSKITPQHCVWIMNLELVKQKLYEFCTQMINDGEKGAEDSKDHFSDIFAQLKNAQTRIIYYIACLFNQSPCLESAFDEFLYNLPDNLNKVSNNDLILKLEPLFEYINRIVKILCENLDFNVCIKVIEQIWCFIIDNIESKLFPFAPGEKQEWKRILIIEKVFPYLVHFFHANGEGLPMEFLEKESECLKSSFSLASLPSSNLIKIYTDLENGLKPQGSNYFRIDPLTLEVHVIFILGCRKGDKESKKFAKSNRDKTAEKVVLKTFGLPSTEMLLESFSCKKGKYENIQGYLYITTNYICFDTILNTGHKVKIPFTLLKNLKRKKTSLSSFTLVLKNGINIKFHSINKTKAYDFIENQADKIGLPLEKIDSNDKSKKRKSDSKKLEDVVETKDPQVDTNSTASYDKTKKKKNTKKK